MDTSTILELVKARLGISTTVRDIYLTAIIESVIKELQDEKGLVLSETNMNHIMFIVDYAEYRYSNKGNPTIPRHLQFRIHNLMIHNKQLIVNNVYTVDTLPMIPEEYTVYILTDGTMQMYINGTWTIVSMVNSVWMVV
ncbi:MAG: hypothetical protein K0Q65_1214 [Clostridia bacterium]|jgi:hypothetical protein|nr:hypothetical protein [Clostridia bacterium]